MGTKTGKGSKPNSGGATRFKPGHEHRFRDGHEPKYLVHGLRRENPQPGDLELVTADTAPIQVAEYVSDLGVTADAVWLALHDAFYPACGPEAHRADGNGHNGSLPSLQVRKMIAGYAEWAAECHETAAMIVGGGLPPAKLGNNLTVEDYERLCETTAREASVIVARVKECADWLAREGYTCTTKGKTRPQLVLSQYGEFINRAKRILRKLASYHAWRQRQPQSDEILEQLRDGIGSAVHPDAGAVDEERDRAAADGTGSSD